MDLSLPAYENSEHHAEGSWPAGWSTVLDTKAVYRKLYTLASRLVHSPGYKTCLQKTVAIVLYTNLFTLWEKMTILKHIFH